MLETVLRRLPRGSGLIFRHYHLPATERRARFRAVRRVALLYGHQVVLAGTAREARAWGAHGAYGPSHTLAHGPELLRLTTAHSLHELRRAFRADALLLSPVFATRSHPGAPTLGPVRFGLLGAQSPVPVIALGGMTARRARHLGTRWAAIDGLT